MKTSLLLLTLFGLFGVTVWWVWDVAESLGGFDMPAAGWAALIFGVVISLVVGVGLMVLVFYSNRKGFDEPPERLE